METYLQKDYITIKYHKAHILISEWLCAFTSSEFREGMNEIINAMEHFKTGKTIWILTNVGALHPGDQQWAATDWQSRALAVGHSHVANILDENIFTQMSVEGSLSETNTKLPIAYFDNLENAIDLDNSR